MTPREQELTKALVSAKESLETLAYLAGSLPNYYDHRDGLEAMRTNMRRIAIAAAVAAGSTTIWGNRPDVSTPEDGIREALVEKEAK